MNSSRMRRTIGTPLSVATGASRPRPPLARGAPGSQPDQTKVKPRCSGKALPRSAALVGWLPALPAHRLANSMIRPRLFTSYKDAAVAAFGISRTQNADVAAVFDVAARIARCLVDVDDAAVGTVSGIELADCDAIESLVGAGAAKACAADERRARGNFDCRDHREKPSSSSCAHAITCGIDWPLNSFANIAGCVPRL